MLYTYEINMFLHEKLTENKHVISPFCMIMKVTENTKKSFTFSKFYSSI